ncbi:PadR family transcriptional regulator [Sphaerisporangium perillae]|uniref:PadR family transcriptional regulator n=1 Tax=Sphaerisporangium perillae TaxID=2935860 RepID=UPI002010155F|nr:PadR family transcriptional regulator [Sphaerisporangium perillae]
MSLRIALLGLLSSSGPASGYDLTKKFERSINHVWQAGHSQIYPELAKMVIDGLVTVGAEGARGRKTYTITREGTAEVRRWLTERTPTEATRSESALEAFLLPLLDGPEALAALARMTSAIEAKLKGLEELQATHRREAATGRTHLGHYALNLGIMQTKTALTWAKETAADLEARMPPT